MNLNKSLEKNVEVVWENEGHTSSAGRPPDATPKWSDMLRPNASKMIQFLENLFKKSPIK